MIAGRCRSATDVGSLAATPMTRDSCLPSLLMRPRVISGGPFVGRGRAEGAGGGGVTDAEVSFSIWYPDASSNPNASVLVSAGGAVGT